MRIRVIASVLTVAALAVGACGNSENEGGSGDDGGGGGGGGTAVDQPGVTDTEIRVGGIASLSNPIGVDTGAAFDGVKAYFEMINSEGGIYGRDLVLASERDDQLANNPQEVQALLSQDNVFAALPIATLLFTGADGLAEAGIPTFGWNVNAEWTGPENFFNQEGALCFTCAGQGLPWLAQEIGATTVGLLAYNVPQSADCATGVQNSFENWPTAEVAFVDTSLSFGNTEYSSQVRQMIDEGVDLVATCMDQNGVLALSREMNQQGLEAAQYLPNAYDQDFMQEYADLFEGAYVRTRFAPFESDPQPEGLQQFVEWMEEIGAEPKELSYVGWIAADTFVTGLREAGEDFTQESVIAALNEMTDYDAGGILPGLDWTIQHQDPTNDPAARPEEDCFVVSQVSGGEFEVVFGDPFICFPTDETAELVTEPEARS